MPDLAAELRLAVARTAAQQLEAIAAQRGWDAGAGAEAMLLSSGGATFDETNAVVFANGFDGSLTTTAFMFGISTFGGPDILP